MGVGRGGCTPLVVRGSEGALCGLSSPWALVRESVFLVARESDILRIFGT